MAYPVVQTKEPYSRNRTNSQVKPLELPFFTQKKPDAMNYQGLNTRWEGNDMKSNIRRKRSIYAKWKETNSNTPPTEMSSEVSNDMKRRVLNLCRKLFLTCHNNWKAICLKLSYKFKKDLTYDSGVTRVYMLHRVDDSMLGYNRYVTLVKKRNSGNGLSYTPKGRISKLPGFGIFMGILEKSKNALHVRQSRKRPNKSENTMIQPPSNQNYMEGPHFNTLEMTLVESPGNISQRKPDKAPLSAMHDFQHLRKFLCESLKERNDLSERICEILLEEMRRGEYFLSRIFYL